MHIGCCVPHDRLASAHQASFAFWQRAAAAATPAASTPASSAAAEHATTALAVNLHPKLAQCA